MSKIKEMPKEEVPTEKALFYGIESLSNAELLAILISCGTKNHSALEIGYEVLSQFNGINGIIKSSVNELTKIEGINKKKALKIKAGFLLYERALLNLNEELLIKGKDNIALYFRNKLKGVLQEKSYIVIVDKNDKILSFKELFIGTQHQVIISPRMVVKEVMNSGNRFYLVHNHPSNECYPSEEDKRTTSQIEFLSCSFGITLVDHLIVTENAYYSILNDSKQSFI